MAEVSSFLRVSTPASVNDVDQRDLETICSLVLLEDPNFFFFFLQNLQVFKKCLDFVKHRAGQATHTFRVPEETPDVAVLCCSNTFPLAKMCSSPLKPRA